MDEYNFYTLKKMHNIAKIDDNAFKDFAELTDLDMNLVSNFVEYQTGSFKGDEIAREYGLEKGPELGAKIKELETQAFLNKL